MKQDEVPQDDARAFAGGRKALYAVGENGKYGLATSTGWEAEEIVLDLVIDQYKVLTEAALQRVRTGKSSPLEYHMHNSRMDATVLAQSTGFFRWQVRRHCNRPDIFLALPPSKLQLYSIALGLSVDKLMKLPNSIEEQQVDVNA